MKSFQRLALITVTALSVCHGASAQQVYRCGNSYSQTPCAGAVAINTDDARTPEQRAEARQALASDKALVKELEAAHRKEAAQALAADKLALSKAQAAHNREEKQDKKPVPNKDHTSKKRTALAKPAEFFTTTDGAVNKKKKTSEKKKAIKE